MFVAGVVLAVVMGVFPSDAVVRRDDRRGTVRSAEAVDLGAAVATDPDVVDARAHDDPGRLAIAVLAACRKSLGLVSPADELRVVDVAPDRSEMRVRLAQVYRGLPVDGAELSVHVDAARRVRLVSGRYVRTPSGVDPRPRLKEAAALRAAGSESAAIGAEPPRLAWYPDDDGRVRLTYRVAVNHGLIRREVVFVDARSGKVISRVPTAFPAGGAGGGVQGP